MQGLADLLERNEAVIARRWLEQVLATYRPDAASFLKEQGNRFANPVGQTYAEQTGTIVAGLLAGEDTAAFAAPLEEILKIRAIQEFTAAQAVAFVFALKAVIRDVVADDLREPRTLTELHALEVRIDDIALLAFDIFVRCREKVYSLRLREIRAGYVQPG